MTINSRTVDQVTIIEMEGNLDSRTAGEAQEQILGLVGDGSHVILDVTKIPYMSSAGLRTLLLLHRHVSANQGKMALVGLASEIKDIMAMTGFLNFFTLCDSLEAGLASVN